MGVAEREREMVEREQVEEKKTLSLEYIVG
jgi:hypothetical protein